MAKCDIFHVLLLLGPPSAPGEPKIVDFDNKSVTLRWTKPKDTGGRPISHYIIQKKDKFGGWFDALITDDDNCTATIEELEARVPGLSEGKWYQFRVIAVNKAGESDPSPHTRPHLCRHKNRKPIRTFLACPFFPAAPLIISRDIRRTKWCLAWQGDAGLNGAGGVGKRGRPGPQP